MSTLEDVQSTLPLIWQRRINRLKATLKRRDLLVVLDEVLSHATFKFDQSSLSGREALRISLGNRNQNDGTTVAVWAYISHDRTGSEPPIVFRDEVPANSNGVTTTRLYPRAASSLLRKARQLRPPFCFLHQELDEGVKDGRGMLCAFVAYYALIAGSSDCAIRWPRFDACLIGALNYINTVVGVPTAKAEVQHEAASNMTASSASMVSPDTPSSGIVLTAQKHGGPCQLNDTPRQSWETINDNRMPTNFANGDHRHNNKSLVVRLEIDRKALAEITGVSQRFKVPYSENEENITLLDEETEDDAELSDTSIEHIGEDMEEHLDIRKTMQRPAVGTFEEGLPNAPLDDVDSVIGDDVDSVIGNEADSVIDDAIDEVIGTANRFDVGYNDRTIHRPTTSKKRKLERIAKDSDGEDFEGTDGRGWRQASWSQRYKG